MSAIRIYQEPRNPHQSNPDPQDPFTASFWLWKDTSRGFMRCGIMIAVLTVLAWFAIGAIAIAAQPPSSYGLIQTSCAPWDGLAIDIRLTTEPAQCKRISSPYINLGVWRGLPIHSGQTVQFGPTSDAGFASRCNKEGDCQRAESGTIVFDKYQDGSGASGRYELHFKDGKNLNGTFSVKWCADRVVCG